MKPFNFLLVSLCILLNLSCLDRSNIADKTPSEVPKQKLTKNSDAESTSTEGLPENNKKLSPSSKIEIAPCASLQMSSEPKLALWEMKNSETLIVCSLGEFYKTSDDEIEGWVNIYPNKVSHELGLIKEVDSELASGFVSFKIKKDSDTKVRVTKFIQDFYLNSAQSLDNAVTEFSIDCSGKICVKTKEKCLNKKSNLEVEQNLLDYVESIAKGKEKDISRFGDYGIVISKIGSFALQGNPQAIEIMLKQELNLGLDGHIAHNFYDAQKTLKNLIELKCINP